VPIDTYHVGFTGTQRHVTDIQLSSLRMVIASLSTGWLHHGDCIEADEKAHAAALEYRVRVVIHPPSNPAKRAWCQGATLVHEPKPYLVRNHDIVDATSSLIAVPFTDDEELRSGTWATVRYARKLGKRIVIVYPNGRTHVE
jgi:hypothetical protein